MGNFPESGVGNGGLQGKQKAGRHPKEGDGISQASMTDEARFSGRRDPAYPVERWFRWLLRRVEECKRFPYAGVEVFT